MRTIECSQGSLVRMVSTRHQHYDQIPQSKQRPRGIPAAGERGAEVHTAAGSIHHPPVEDPCGFASAGPQQSNNLTFRYGIG